MCDRACHSGLRRLPPGLSFSNGIISGIPTTAGTYNVIVTVNDSETPALHTSVNYSITITS